MLLLGRGVTVNAAAWIYAWLYPGFEGKATQGQSMLAGIQQRALPCACSQSLSPIGGSSHLVTVAVAQQKGAILPGSHAIQCLQIAHGVQWNSIW